MRNVVLVFFLLLNCSFGSIREGNNCSSCRYYGSISKVKLNEKNAKYSTTKMEQGEAMLQILEENCEIVDNCFYLQGIVYTTRSKDGSLMSPVSDVLLLKATGYDNSYQVTETLAKTDANGRFAFKVYNSRFDGSIFIVQRDGSCVRYAMGGFKN